MKRYICICVLTAALIILTGLDLYSNDLSKADLYTIDSDIISMLIGRNSNQSEIGESAYYGIKIEERYSKYYKLMSWKKVSIEPLPTNINTLPRFSSIGKINLYNAYFSIFLNIFPGFGLGSFIFDNSAFGVIQALIQSSSLIFYIIGLTKMDKTSYDTWIFPHTMINTGHYIFFGGIIFGIVSAVVYAIQHPMEENEF